MTRKEIEEHLSKCPAALDLDPHLLKIIKELFIYTASWRINAVWHPANEEPIKPQHLLLIEHNNGEFELNYRFDPATTKRWACVEDLIPSKEE